MIESVTIEKGIDKGLYGDMDKTQFKIEKEKLLKKLADFQSIIKNSGDHERETKVTLLAKKLLNEEFVIGFCGHFSAGKSAMINELTGESILPSSPIPTSANLIALHTGDKKQIRVTLSDDTQYDLLPPLGETSISALGKEGLKIKKIDVWRSSSELPEGITVLDTPGIDSVDDAHKRSTESAIHLADQLFYVMDYNHVQSEMNFEYIKKMVQHNRKISAVINQIDKHREEEIPFDVYRQSVQDAFTQWGAVPEAFYYTSLKDSVHPHNQLYQLKEMLHQIVSRKYELMLSAVESGLSLIQAEHKEYLEDEMEEIRLAYEEIVTDQDLENRAAIFEEEEQLEQETSISSFKSWSESYDIEKEKLLKDAYLMPADVRLKAEQFLESTQNSFKTGVFFAAKKTETERIRRKEAFVQALHETVENQLIWHAKSFVYRFIEKGGASRTEWAHKVEGIEVSELEGLIHSSVKPGAGFNGNALLHYCDDLAAAVRRTVKIQLEQLKSEIVTELEDHIEESSVKKEAGNNRIRQKANIIRQIEKIEAALTRAEQSESIGDDLQAVFIQGWSEENRDIYAVSSIQELLSDSEEQTDHDQHPAEQSQKSSESLDEEYIIKKSYAAADLLKKISGFTHQSKTLKGQAERLSNKRFTVSLFGAFSAGKSSFANAIIGRKVLPVSPNPTTASINRINPPNEEFPDKTAVIHFKKERELLEDLRSVSESPIESIESAGEVLPAVVRDRKDLPESKKSFIRAFLKGYSSYGSELGKSVKVSFEAFAGYVSNEHQSCFVESIDLYIDSPLAESGITLVDTPGADSVNARHTDVSFDYIRNSDAVLFVTYYNHAFARADREFLIQMGRLKESFELDKMFFLVNAVDLASNDQEKDDVIQYVQAQLMKFGIRQPKIFGVSSLQALNEETRQQSGIDEFNGQFHSFIEGDLHAIALQNAHDYLDQTIHRMKVLIDRSENSAEEKEQYRNQLMEHRQKIEKALSDLSFTALRNQAEQELSELIYYVKQRVFYRYPDFFKESFNPSRFSQMQPKPALEKSINELISVLGFDFMQELKVVNHRMDLFIEKSLMRDLEILWDMIREDFLNGMKPVIRSSTSDMLTFPQLLSGYDHTEFAKEKSYYKNNRSFFEKNEKKFMKDALGERLKQMADQEIADEQVRIHEWVQTEIQLKGKAYFTQWKEEMTEQITAEISTLDSTEMTAELKRVYRLLTTAGDERE